MVVVVEAKVETEPTRIVVAMSVGRAWVTKLGDMNFNGHGLRNMGFAGKQ